MTQRLCIDCRSYQAGEWKSGAQDRCTNPAFIDLTTSDVVRGTITRIGDGFCQALRKDVTACGPQASKWEPHKGETDNG